MNRHAIKSVAVVGAGTMGQGIALSCALAGYQVLLYDVSNEYLQKAIQLIDKSLDGLVEKNKITPFGKRESIKRIKTVDILQHVQADLIIEAIIEDLQAKQNLFIELEKHNSLQSIFASNTSSISITKIASVLNHRNRLIGLHFFNPAHIMKLVEIIETTDTSSAITHAANDFVKSLSKASVTAKDSPGFIVNRVARHYYLESLKLLEEGATDISSIDKLLKSAGFKMGPFELMDLIGVDINLAVSKSVYNAFENEIRFKPSSIQEKLVKEGNFGKKTGKGFYDYKKE